VANFLTGLATIAQGFLEGRMAAEEAQRQMQQQALTNALNIRQVQSTLQSAALNRQLAQAAEQRAGEEQQWWRQTRETPAEESARKLRENLAATSKGFELQQGLELPGLEQLARIQL